MNKQVLAWSLGIPLGIGIGSLATVALSPVVEHVRIQPNLGEELAFYYLAGKYHVDNQKSDYGFNVNKAQLIFLDISSSRKAEDSSYENSRISDSGYIINLIDLDMDGNIDLAHI